MSRHAPLLAAVAVAAALVVLASPATASASQYVRDDARIIPADVEARIEDLSARLEGSTPGAELVVVTVVSLDDRDISEYAEELFEELGIGSEDLNNGVLLLVAPNERRVRIEVGYGLEGAIPDSRAGNIIDTDIIPRFAEGDMAGGIEAGHARLAGLIAHEYETEVPGATPVKSASWWGVLAALLGLGSVVALVRWAIKKGHLKVGGPGGGSSGGSPTPTPSTWSGSSSSWGSDSSSSSGSSFGDSFGGGDSGGGGASGGW